MNPLRKGYSALKHAQHERELDQLFQGHRAAAEFVEKYHTPQLSPEDKQKIDTYWAQFGVKFRDYSYHRMFYQATGIHDPRFIPENFSVRVIFPYYNDLSKLDVFADKNLFYRLMPGIKFPTRLGYRSRNRFYDADGKYYGEAVTEEFAEAIWQAILRSPDPTSVILKKAKETSLGKGVRKVFVSSRQDVLNALKETDQEDYVIQATLMQHDFFKQFNESSVNIIRVTSWRMPSGEVKFFSPTLRFGIPGSATDVAYVDGEEILNGVAIDKNGFADNKAWHLDGTYTPLDLKIKQVPSWDRIIALLTKNHLTMDYYDAISWDVTVDDTGEVICMEYNIRGPGAVLYQLAHGPLAGDDTEAYLGFLKNPENQKKYLPKSIRIKK